MPIRGPDLVGDGERVARAMSSDRGIRMVFTYRGEIARLALDFVK